MWNEPKRPRTESRRMGKVDRKAKKGSNSPSIPNCLVSTLLGQTIVLCRFKLDFTLRKSASIDISDSESGGDMAGWEWCCAIPFACYSLMPN